MKKKRGGTVVSVHVMGIEKKPGLEKDRDRCLRHSKRIATQRHGIKSQSMEDVSAKELSE